jgi:hypothetical protein
VFRRNQGHDRAEGGKMEERTMTRCPRNNDAQGSLPILVSIGMGRGKLEKMKKIIPSFSSQSHLVKSQPCSIYTFNVVSFHLGNGSSFSYIPKALKCLMKRNQAKKIEKSQKTDKQKLSCLNEEGIQMFRLTLS